eukprot:scaffold4637_cov128-Cylindrotheca_fusiformis.AAC.25
MSASCAKDRSQRCEENEFLLLLQPQAQPPELILLGLFCAWTRSMVGFRPSRLVDRLVGDTLTWQARDKSHELSGATVYV